MQKVNRAILALEGIPLAYLSFLGVLLITGALVPIATGDRRRDDVLEAVAALVVLAGLVAGWRLLIAYVAYGPRYARHGMGTWWLIACCAAGFALVGFLWPHSVLQLFGLGIYFLPSFLHLAVSVWGGLLPNLRWSGPW